MDKKTERYIINVLRQGTIKWEARTRAIKKIRVMKLEGRYKNGDLKFKYYWKCPKCLKKYRDSSYIEVDHVIEIGSFKGNWGKFIRRMYCDQSNLQAICVNCHLRKTKANSTLRWERKRKEKRPKRKGS